jgi:hypothetical protein
MNHFSVILLIGFLSINSCKDPNSSSAQNANIKRFETDIRGCEVFMEGRFYSLLPDGRKITIERKKDLQIEKLEGKEYQYDIEWIGPCRYKISEIGSSENEYADMITNIFEYDENSYKCIVADGKRTKYDLIEIYILK